MNNKEILQKLIAGKDEKQTILIKYEGEDLEFTIKPLTSYDLTELQTIEKQPLAVNIDIQKQKTNMQNGVEVNAGDFAKAQKEAMYTAIGRSLEVKIDDVKQLPAGLPELIFAEIIKISELDKTDLISVKSFLQNE